ncbi:MAG: MBL fold metallo-hydrolase, partial [Candidatus Thorarchaeota archaeon]
MNRNQLIGATIVCALLVSITAFVSIPLVLTPPDGATNTTNPTDSVDETPLEPPEGLHYNGVDISYLKIMGFKLAYEELVVYIDPSYFYVDRNDSFLVKADYILISHDHPTHCSAAIVDRLSDNDTIVIAAPGPAEIVDADVIVKPGDVLSYDKVNFEFIPSYCYEAVFLGTTRPMHTQSENNTGVIVDFEGTRIYHA